MKLHQKITAIVLCAAVFFCAAPLSGFVGLNLPSFDFSFSASAEVKTGTCGESVTWSLDTETDVLTISGTGDMNNFSGTGNMSPWHDDPSTPWEDDPAIKSVIIENGVTSIGSYAFYRCINLTSITIPDGVTSIGDSAFDFCGEMTSIDIPDSVTSIGEAAFLDCFKLTSIDLPNRITSISNRTFLSCSGLTSITIPDGVTSIGDAAFCNCTGLTPIDIPDSVEKIGEVAFGSCWELTSIIIPDGVKTIGRGAFYDCKKLASVVIPDSVTTIDAVAFKSCGSLTSIDIPDSVTYIGPFAFSFCDSLTSINIEENNLKYSSVNGVLFNQDRTELIWYPAEKPDTTYILPDGVTSIGRQAFYGCTGLTSITIPDSVTSIGRQAFCGCTGLTSITIPDSVTSINESTFYRCPGLTSITIPNSVTSIGEYAFYGCSRLTSIDIPDGVTSIGEYAFYGCSGLTSIDIPDGVTSICDYTFSDCSGLTSIDIPDGVTSIGEYAFYGCYGLTSISIPDSITSIDKGAFHGTEYYSNANNWENDVLYMGNILIEAKYSLSGDYTVKSSTKYITKGAFKECEKLTSITIPEGVLSIAADAFIGCTRLLSITISDSITSVGKDAFYNTGYYNNANNWENDVLYIGNILIEAKSSLSGDYTVKSGTKCIATKAFDSCENLTLINIPDSVTSIGDAVFSTCTVLTSVNVAENNPNYLSMDGVLFNEEKTELICYPARKTNVSYTIPDSVTSIGDYAISFCAQLTSITLPKGLTSIGEFAFAYCVQLTSITLPKGLTSIGGYAFLGCGLTTVNIPNSITSISQYMFYGCINLYSIYIPENVTSIGDFAIQYDSIIIGKPGSYAQTYAEVSDYTFLPVDETTITLYALATTAEPLVHLVGHAYIGKPVKIYDGDVLIGETTADEHYKWSADVELNEPSAEGSVHMITAVTENGGIPFTSEPVEITYAPNNVLFESFTFKHFYCSFYTLNADSFGNPTRNFTWVPGMPSSFSVTLHNDNLVANLYVVSTKDGVEKSIKLTYNEATDTWIGSGCFDSEDMNYIPGVITIRALLTDGTELLLGVPIKLNFLVDPSGYAYEAVKSNVLAGVTSEIYYQATNGDSILWDAERYDQLNPITTFSDGVFAWVVPEGKWQVKLSAEGYSDGLSEWMDVPPEHFNVYIPMMSTVAPTVEYFNVYADSAEVTFSQYMDISTINNTNISVGGKSGTWEALDAEECGWDDGISFARAFRFTPEGAITGETAISVSGVKNYAGIALAETYSQTAVLAEKVTALASTAQLTLTYGESGAITVTAQPAAAAAGKTVSVVLANDYIVSCDSTLTLDENGQAQLNVTALLPGAVNVQFMLDGAVLDCSSEITVGTGEHEHTFPEEWTVITTATCTESGVSIKKCTSCREIIVSNPAPAHTVVDVAAVPASCTEVGYTAGTHCSVCGEVFTAQTTIPALGHAWNNGVITTAATCTARGVKTFTCTRCNATKTEAVATVAHTIVNDAAVAATCTATGLTAGTHCSVCNTVITAQRTVSALGHADDNDDGICDLCGEDIQPHEQECSCDCHSDSFFKRIFWKLKVFFWKLFGADEKQYCSCGEAHW